MESAYVKSAWNQQQIANDGYLYTRDKVYKNKVYWKCVEYNKFQCKGRLQTRNGKICGVNGDHNHEKRHADIAARTVLANIKQKATTSTETPQQIIGDISGELSLVVACKLPKVPLIKRQAIITVIKLVTDSSFLIIFIYRTIQRTRNRHNESPRNPNSLEDLVIPEKYKKTRKGEDFLFIDTGPGAERIIVFATNRAIDMLSKSDHWHADGTFKTSPLLFAQTYTIHGVRNQEVVPALYALLPNQTAFSSITNSRELSRIELSSFSSALSSSCSLFSFNSFSLSSIPLFSSLSCQRIKHRLV
ncbi:uncharacterized protein B4U80_00590 [Leptotrombidium deliense]|uniref:FLYWCH-type domain-containing protein n=1 Tax=Leptotrombidium deliense TaxID=299467 RepID=A0A443S5U1_9ACAR|nr:uncharacterized protein B4U80_00590 [Leptotrombidium deliense]